MAEVIRCAGSRRSRYGWRTPASARLSLSVPPEVKTISLACALSSAAMALRARSTAERVRWPAWCAELGLLKALLPERTHGLDDFGEKRRRRVRVEIDALHDSILVRAYLRMVSRKEKSSAGRCPVACISFDTPIGARRVEFFIATNRSNRGFFAKMSQRNAKSCIFREKGTK